MTRGILLVFFLWIVGCAAGGGPACTPSATQACVCGGGAMGVQTCNAMGTGFGTCGMCSSPVPDAGSSRACVPNESRACACSGGTMGAQTCNADGSAFNACQCPMTAPRCGDGMCNGTETCSSCAGDCGMCAARCGDGTCNGTETCMSCSRDCGMCMSTPRCGDGMCNGSETCSSCSDDCGACPPRCGDGMCNGSETCTDCAQDCGTCGVNCQACATNTDCPSGMMCGRRSCDGAGGCYTPPTTNCATIGGISCPSTAAYNRCLGDSECGPLANCRSYSDGAALCSRRCTSNNECPPPPSTSPQATATCDTRNMRCYLRCTGPGTCPYGLACFRFDDGTYGYCS